MEIELWPNPVSKMLNSHGKEVIVSPFQKGNTGTIQLDVSSLAKGLYYLQLLDESVTKTIAAKFVIR